MPIARTQMGWSIIKILVPILPLGSAWKRTFLAAGGASLQIILTFCSSHFNQSGGGGVGSCPVGSIYRTGL